MKQVQLSGFGLENLAVHKVPMPKPGPGEVLIKVAACSINYRDFMIAQGFYKPDLSFPLVPVSDGCGYIEQVGEGVTAWKPGDRVVTTLWQDWENGPLTADKRQVSAGCEAPGVLQEFAVLPETAIVRAPAALSDAEAACLPAAGLTAFAGLTTFGKLQPGGTVLTLGTGGVSLFALQFAKAMGATVVITSGSDAKLAKAQALGADHGLNYQQQPDWGEQCAALTGGADVVIETGGAGTLAQSMAALACSGRIAYIGALAGFSAETNLMPLVLKNASIHGVTVSHRQDHEAMNAFIEAHAIRPVISCSYPFADGIAAIADIAKGDHFGKLVVEF